MKRKDLIIFVERNLQAFGFKQGQWLWQKGGIVLLVNGQLKQIALKASMTKAKLIFEMGRLAGLCEALGMVRSEKQVAPDAPILKTARPNGHAADGFGNLASLAGMAA